MTAQQNMHSDTAESTAAQQQNSTAAKQRRRNPTKKATSGGTGTDLWLRAEEKATAEMRTEFEYQALCEQGRKLYHLVLRDKTVRLHNKLKLRHKQRKNIEID